MEDAVASLCAVSWGDATWPSVVRNVVLAAVVGAAAFRLAGPRRRAVRVAAAWLLGGAIAVAVLASVLHLSVCGVGRPG